MDQSTIYYVSLSGLSEHNVENCGHTKKNIYIYIYTSRLQYVTAAKLGSEARFSKVFHLRRATRNKRTLTGLPPRLSHCPHLATSPWAASAMDQTDWPNVASLEDENIQSVLFHLVALLLQSFGKV